MGKKSSKQITAGMILSYLNIGIGSIIPVFYTPVMLSLMGQNEYGLYKLASSTTSYLSLLSFGVGSAITRYLIKANIENGKDGEEKIFGLFYLFFQAIAILTCLVGIVLIINLDKFYGVSLSSTELYRMKIIVGLMTLNTAVSFSASSYNAVVTAHERFIFIHSLNILSTIGAPVANIIALYLGYRSIGMAVISLSINTVIRIIYIFYVRRGLHLKPQFQQPPFKLLKEIFTFSFWIFVSNIVGQIYSATDTVIIGMIPKLATTGVAVYNIGITFPNIMFGLAQVTPGLFMPQANRMVFGGSSDEELTDLVIKVGRMQAFIVMLVCSGFITFGIPFINLYAGPAYKEAYWVAVIIMIPDCIPLVQSVAHSILQAKNKHKFRSIMYLIIAIINAVLTWYLVRVFGIIGAAIPTGLAYLIGHGFIMNWYYWKRLHLNIPRFWKSLVPIFTIAIALTMSGRFISRIVNFYDIKLLFLGIIIYTILYSIFCWILAMNDEEKRIIKNVMIVRD